RRLLHAAWRVSQSEHRGISGCRRERALLQNGTSVPATLSAVLARQFCRTASADSASVHGFIAGFIAGVAAHGRGAHQETPGGLVSRDQGTRRRDLENQPS